MEVIEKKKRKKNRCKIMKCEGTQQEIRDNVQCEVKFE